VFDRLVSDLIVNTRARIKDAGVRSVDAIRRHPQRLAAFSHGIQEAQRELKEFLHENLYFSPALAGEKEDAERIVGELFAHWMEEPDDLPRSYREKAALLRGPQSAPFLPAGVEEPLPRVICDYIAGMTDPFIFQQYEKYCGE